MIKYYVKWMATRIKYYVKYGPLDGHKAVKWCPVCDSTFGGPGPPETSPLSVGLDFGHRISLHDGHLVAALCPSRAPPRATGAI